MNYKQFLKKYSIHLGVYIIISMLIIVGSILINNSRIYTLKYTEESWNNITPFIPNTNISYNILFDQHSHTYYSDGILSVEENLKWHIAMGFNAIAITDHNTLRNSKDIEILAEKYKNQIIVIQGMEWTSNKLHMNFLGINEWNLRITSEPTDLQIQETIEEVHQQGGVVVANHLPWTTERAENVPSREELLTWGVDYIEIVNEGEFDQESYEFCLLNNESIGMITGTDMHNPNEIYSWTAMNVTSFTEMSILEVLRAKNTIIIYEENGAPEVGITSRNIAHTILRPFYDFGGTLSEYYYGHGQLDVPSVIVFFAYYFGVFVLFELFLQFRDKRKTRRENKES